MSELAPILDRVAEKPSVPLAIVGDPGTGKGLPMSSPILTPTGYVRNGDLSVGDLVIARNGKPTKVTGVFPQGVKPCYRVTFSDGSSIVCDEDHLWKVIDKSQRGIEGERNKEYVIDTKELAKRPLYQQEGEWKRWLYYIPMCDPVQFVEKEGTAIAIDPWLLGVLIGDGSLSGHMLSLSNTEEDIIQRVRSLLREIGYDLHPRNENNRNDWVIVFNGMPNLYKLALSIYDLRCKSENKSVPDCCKMGSVETRIAILQGLMDTDGTVGKDGKLTYSTSSKQLAEDIAFMVQSLGGTASISLKPNCGYRDKEGIFHRCLDSYTLYIKCDITLVSNKKHLAKIKDSHVSVYRQIRAIEPVEPQETQCIMVEDAEHLYLCNDFIVTHNTQQIESWAKQHNLPCVKLLASTLDQTDVAGIIVRDGNNAKTLSPDWINKLTDRGVLFLDELNTAIKEVQDALLTLICSRHLPNGEKLGDGVMIIAAMNDADQCDNYELSPAMRTRFMWIKHAMPMSKWASWFLGTGRSSRTITNATLPAFQTQDEWLEWFQAEPEHDADKKALLTEAMKGGLTFDVGNAYVEKETATCPRGLTNLFYWCRNAYEAVYWAPAFVSDEAANILRSVNVTAYKNVANSVFQNKRKQVDVSDEEAEKLNRTSETINKIQEAVNAVNP